MSFVEAPSRGGGIAGLWTIDTQDRAPEACAPTAVNAWQHGPFSWPSWQGAEQRHAPFSFSVTLPPEHITNPRHKAYVQHPPSYVGHSRTGPHRRLILRRCWHRWRCFESAVQVKLGVGTSEATVLLPEHWRGLGNMCRFLPTMKTHMLALEAACIHQPPHITTPRTATQKLRQKKSTWPQTRASRVMFQWAKASVRWRGLNGAIGTCVCGYAWWSAQAAQS